MYYKGEGVPQNYSEAFKWFKKLAEKGDAKAQGFLGAMYSNGEGVPQNYVKAYAWLNLASAQGQKEAEAFISYLEKNMTPEQIAEGQKEAAQLWEKFKNQKNQ